MTETVRTRKFGVALVCAILLVMGGAVGALAVPVTQECIDGPATESCFRPAFVRTGAAPVPNPPVAVEVTENDLVVGVHDVSLSMRALFGAGSTEFISDLVMNVDPDISLSALTFIQTGGPLATIAKGAHGEQSLSPEGGFDVKFSWSTSNKNGGALRFNENDLVEFIVVCTLDSDCDDLDATSFDVTTAAGFRIGAHVQGIPGSPCLENNEPATGTCPSGKVFGVAAPTPTRAVPVPATLVLVGIAVAGALGIGRRRTSGSSSGRGGENVAQDAIEIDRGALRAHDVRRSP